VQVWVRKKMREELRVKNGGGRGVTGKVRGRGRYGEKSTVVESSENVQKYRHIEAQQQTDA
jgi:hypothetical protein